MSKLYHPDKNKGDEESSKKFVDIAAAYETLSDKDKRRIYDQGGEEALKQQQGGGGARDPFDIFSGFGGFGGFGHQQQRGVAEERRGDDVRLDLDATLEDLYSGRVYEVLLKQQHLCPHCRGTGAESDSDVVKCSTCQGRGVVMKTVSLGPGFMQQMQQTCEVCGGRGKTIRHKCHVCSGRKVTTGTKKLDVVLEMGMPDGHAIEFENAADEHPDHAPGHVIFTVRTLPHQRFTRQGHDLHVTEIISLREVRTRHTREEERDTALPVTPALSSDLVSDLLSPVSFFSRTLVSRRLLSHSDSPRRSCGDALVYPRDAARRRAARVSRGHAAPQLAESSRRPRRHLRGAIPGHAHAGTARGTRQDLAEVKRGA